MGNGGAIAPPCGWGIRLAFPVISPEFEPVSTATKIGPRRRDLQGVYPAGGMSASSIASFRTHRHSGFSLSTVSLVWYVQPHRQR